MRTVELVVERFSNSGDGVALLDGRAVFISGAIPGERVLVDVNDAGKVLHGQLKSVLAPSPDRRVPPCALADRCGGCDWLHLNESRQLREKQGLVLATLEHVGGIARSELEVLPVAGAPAAQGARRRATLHPVGGALGFNARQSHERVAVEHCPALTPGLADLPAKLAAHLGAATLKDLEEARFFEGEGQLSISLHFKAALRPKHRALAESAVKEGLVDGVVLHPADGKGATELVGEPSLSVEGVLYRPDGFAQANEAVNRALVGAAVERLELSGEERVLELYSGNGNFTFRLAERAKQVIAVESSALSVSLAQRAAVRRGSMPVRFMQGDAEKLAAGMVKEAERFDRLLVDPPRTGAPGIAGWASGLLVSRVVYVACDPVSLARDARALAERGYQPRTLQVFDLFPQTHHVEALMSFSR